MDHIRGTLVLTDENICDIYESLMFIEKIHTGEIPVPEGHEMDWIMLKPECFDETIDIIKKEFQKIPPFNY